MITVRQSLLSALLVLASQAAAAQEHGRVFFRHDSGAPEMSVTSTLPLMAWGPGSVTATPAVMGRLFPPTLIMQRQNELALTDQQQETIKAELREFQSEVVDVQWDLQSSQGALESLLAEDRIDADAAAGAIDRVLAAENALKKLHLTLLIRIRNVLAPEQITTLEGSFRSHRGWVMPLAPQPPPTP